MSKRSRKTPDDASHIPEVAETLGLTEFDLFEAAYEAWFREPATVIMLERHFARYMFSGVAPVWVRAYARNVLSDENSSPRGERPPPRERVTELAEGYVATLRLLWSLTGSVGRQVAQKGSGAVVA